jgi:hypothetical protein
VVDRQEEIYRAKQDFDSASRAIHQALPGKAGFGIEAVYGQTYQRLYQLGAVPQLKKKYRGK